MLSGEGDHEGYAAGSMASEDYVMFWGIENIARNQQYIRDCFDARY